MLLIYFGFGMGNSRSRSGGETNISEAFYLQSGLGQGVVIAPGFFNIYMEGLSDWLNATQVGPYVNGVCMKYIACADDMVLLAPSIRELRRLICIYEQYVNKHGMIYKDSKTQLVVFRQVRGLNVVPPVRLNGNIIATSFKYPGHVIRHDDDDRRP